MNKSGKASILIIAITAFLLFSPTFGADKAPRSPGYGAVMQSNAAVDFTVSDYIMRPHLIGSDLQFVSGFSSPEIGNMIDGAFSFKGAGLNWFGSMANHGRFPTVNNNNIVSQVRAGMGLGNTFGVGLMYELNKATNDNEAANTTTKVQHIGDAYGVFGSFNLGAVNLWADISRTTGPTNATSIQETEAGDTENSNTTTSVKVGIVKDTEGEGSHALGVTLDLSMMGLENEGPPNESDTLLVLLNLNHGVPFKYNENFAVFAGSNTNIAYLTGEDTSLTVTSSGMFFSFAPNIEFQRKLGKGFEISLGSSINFFTWSSDQLENSDGDQLTDSGVETGFFGAGSTTGDVALGLRWEYENVAVDGQMSKGLLRNGPDFIGGAAPGVFSSVGLTLGF